MKFIKIDSLISSGIYNDKQIKQMNRLKEYFTLNGKSNGYLKYQNTMKNMIGMLDSNVENAFIERLIRAKKIGCKVTLKKMVILYGKKEGSKKWEIYCNRQRETNTYDYKKKKYGWTEDQFEDYNKSRSVTLENMIKKYGKKKGTEKWEIYRNKQKDVGCSLDYFQEKYGKNEGKEYYEKLNWKKGHSLDFYIWKYGEEEGKKEHKKYWSNKNSSFSSKVSQRLFWLIYSKLNKEEQEHCYFADLNKEFGVNNGVGYNFYDFVITNKMICIEFNGDYWHANPKLYHPNDNIKYPNGIEKAKNIWENDNIKNGYIEEKGYTVYTVWQRDFVLNETEIVNKIIGIIYDKCNKD